MDVELDLTHTCGQRPGLVQLRHNSRDVLIFDLYIVLLSPQCTRLYIYIYIYIYTNVCVCVCPPDYWVIIFLVARLY